ncbi:hypothetical protein [Mesorhizobium sp. B261B1A]|uniref:hypothetical protein n=1 Tax=unclassified Mesorhizobium TaxID=325217 RepID=UPI00398C3E91
MRVGKDDSAFDTFAGYSGNVFNNALVAYWRFRHQRSSVLSGFRQWVFSSGFT